MTNVQMTNDETKTCNRSVLQNLLHRDDAADHQKLQIKTARQVIDRLMIQNDPAVARNAATESEHWDGAGVTAGPTRRAIETLNRANAEDTFAAMSLACHLFFHGLGRWPNSIEELVPGYLPHQSVDPWGQPGGMAIR